MRPGGATQVLISNDGGFTAPATRSVAASGLYPWTLFRTRHERLPKTVYVRFGGLTGVSSQTFTDDIILDETDPTVERAELAVGTTVTSTTAVAAAQRRRFTLRIRARDNASGVGKMHKLATTKRRRGRLIKYRRRYSFTATRPPAYVRVRDRAGNRSRWRRIRS